MKLKKIEIIGNLGILFLFIEDLNWINFVFLLIFRMNSII